MNNENFPAAAVAAIFIAVAAGAVIVRELNGSKGVNRRAARLVSDVEKVLCMAYKALR